MDDQRLTDALRGRLPEGSIEPVPSLDYPTFYVEPAQIVETLRPSGGELAVIG